MRQNDKFLDAGSNNALSRRVSLTPFFALPMPFFRRSTIFCQNIPPILLKIRRPPFRPLAFFTFRDGFDLASLEQSLHFYLTAAGTEKFLPAARGTGILAYRHASLLI
jgi:hypothetical protein